MLDVFAVVRSFFELVSGLSIHASEEGAMVVIAVREG